MVFLGEEILSFDRNIINLTLTIMRKITLIST